MTSGDYSKGAQKRSKATQGVLELEAATSEPSRVQEPSEAVSGLTIAEAATAFGLSVSSLRRLLKAGKLVGAVKVPGPKGVEYRIPPSSLEALGYGLKESLAGAGVKASRVTIELEVLSVRVKELEASLELEAVKRQAAERELEAVRGNLDDLREVLSKLPRAIEPGSKRRLFRRG